MTRTRPAPQHGERACYLRGCRQPECADANYRYMSRWRLETQRGQTRRIDSQPAADHVRALLNAGWNQRQIANAAGCTHRAISALTRDQFPTTMRHISDAVLAIPVGPPPAAIQYTDATGTIRRIRALVAIGYPLAHIAPAIGIHVCPLGRIARGELAQVRVSTARAVADVYQQLRWKPGPSPRARNHATRNGWHSPLAWDDNQIDDPTAKPDTDNPTDPQLSRDELAALRRTEIEHLASFGVPTHEIAERLGISTKTVHQVHVELRTGIRRDRTKQGAAA